MASHGYYQLTLNKFASDVGGSYFDLVRGDLTIRNLDICVGGSAGNGGSFVLAANIESSAGFATQLGYGQEAGSGSLFFFYARGNPPDEIKWSTTYLPVVGDRYRFSITRVSGDGGLPDTVFKIQNLDAGGSSSKVFSGWPSGLNHAWWGAETHDSFSAHGVPAGQANQNVAYMGYSPNNSSTISYRSGLTCSDVFKNFVWDGSSDHTGCNGFRHGHVGNWVYGGDKLAVESH